MLLPFGKIKTSARLPLERYLAVLKVRAAMLGNDRRLRLFPQADGTVRFHIWYGVLLGRVVIRGRLAAESADRTAIDAFAGERSLSAGLMGLILLGASAGLIGGILDSRWWLAGGGALVLSGALTMYGVTAWSRVREITRFFRQTSPHQPPLIDTSTWFIG